MIGKFSYEEEGEGGVREGEREREGGGEYGSVCVCVHVQEITL